MSYARNPIGEQEVRYFSKVTASVSHELKNVLAILNEHAGLLQDFVSLAEQGQSLDVVRIRRLSATMLGQIGRGDAIIKRMNRFAHSADQDRATVDLKVLVAMVVEMFARTAATRGVMVEVTGTDKGLSITTNPLALETLLGILLDRVTEAAPGIVSCVIELHSLAGGGQIRIAGLENHKDAVASLLESTDLGPLLAALQAVAAFSGEHGALVITLPDNIDS